MSATHEEERTPITEPVTTGSIRRPLRTVAVRNQQESLSTSYLGGGLSSVALAVMSYELLRFTFTWGTNPRPGLSLAAWILLLLAFVGTTLVIGLSGRRLPTGAYALFLIAIAAVVGLDIAAVAGPPREGVALTAAPAAAVAHVALIVHRRARDIILVSAAVIVAMLVLFVAQGPGGPDTFGLRVGSVVVTIASTVVAVSIIRAFRRMVTVEVDRALVQSTTLGPRFAVGMLASEELARLDFAAERLLSDVADGTIALPLDPQRATHAASLATQLRLHLVEGRRETWLHHAITESEFLGPLVTLEDPHGAAGLLDHRQRDGLLSAIWLIIDSASGPGPALQVAIGVVRSDTGADGRRSHSVPVVLSAQGVLVRRIDPAAWEAIEQVGTFDESTREGSVRIDIECLVENPADR